MTWFPGNNNLGVEAELLNFSLNIKRTHSSPISCATEACDRSRFEVRIFHKLLDSLAVISQKGLGSGFGIVVLDIL